MITQYLLDVHKAETERYLKFSVPPITFFLSALEQCQQRLKCIEHAMVAISQCTPEGTTEVSDEHKEAVDTLHCIIDGMHSENKHNADADALIKVLEYLGTIY